MSKLVATEIVRSLQLGKAPVVTPDRPDQIRGRKNSLTRTGIPEEPPGEVWDVDGKLYMMLRVEADGQDFEG